MYTRKIRDMKKENIFFNVYNEKERDYKNEEIIDFHICNYWNY